MIRWDFCNVHKSSCNLFSHKMQFHINVLHSLMIDLVLWKLSHYYCHNKLLLLGPALLAPWLDFFSNKASFTAFVMKIYFVSVVNKVNPLLETGIPTYGSTLTIKYIVSERFLVFKHPAKFESTNPSMRTSSSDCLALP